MINLIGIAGRAHSGKDSLGKFFVGAGYRRVGFADALKRVVADIANEDASLYFNEVSKEEFSFALQMTRREALQNVGQHMRQALGPDVWVRNALSGWDAAGRPTTVITDVRYPNEARAIRERGGVVLRLVRPGSGLVGAAAAHTSEVDLPEDLVDVELCNDGTLGELKAEAMKLVWLYTGGTT